MQRVPGPAGFEGRAFADGQGARSEDRDFDGLTFFRAFSFDEVWGYYCTARVGGEEGCNQHSADGGVFGLVAGETWNGEGQSSETEVGVVGHGTFFLELSYQLVKARAAVPRSER